MTTTSVPTSVFTGAPFTCTFTAGRALSAASITRVSTTYLGGSEVIS